MIRIIPYSAVQLFAYESYKVILEPFVVIAIVKGLLGCLMYIMLGIFRNYFGETTVNYQFGED